MAEPMLQPMLSNTAVFASSRRGPYDGNQWVPWEIGPPVSLRRKIVRKAGRVDRVVAWDDTLIASTRGRKHGFASYQMSTGELQWEQHADREFFCFGVGGTRLFYDRPIGNLPDPNDLPHGVVLDCETGNVVCAKLPPFRGDETLCVTEYGVLVGKPAGSSAIWVDPAMKSCKDISPSKVVPMCFTVGWRDGTCLYITFDDDTFQPAADAVSRLTPPEDRSDRMQLVLLDVEAGTPRWRADLNIVRSDVLCRCDPYALVGSDEGYLMFDTSTGDLLWGPDKRCEYKSDFLGTYPCLHPDRGLVVVPTMGERRVPYLECLNAKTGESIWRQRQLLPDDNIRAMRMIATGSRLWHVGYDFGETSPVGFFDEPMAGDAHLVCRDIETGQMLWNTLLRKSPDPYLRYWNHLQAPVLQAATEDTLIVSIEKKILLFGA